MVGVIPGDEPMGGHEHCLGLLVESITIVGIDGEDWHYLEKPTGGQTHYIHLTIVSTGEERIELIVLSGWHIDLLGDIRRDATLSSLLLAGVYSHPHQN